VLAVVEQDECAPPGQVRDEPLPQRRAVAIMQAEGRRQHGFHPLGLAHGREVDPPHAVDMASQLLLRQLQREPRLPSAADTRKG